MAGELSLEGGLSLEEAQRSAAQIIGEAESLRALNANAEVIEANTEELNFRINEFRSMLGSKFGENLSKKDIIKMLSEIRDAFSYSSIPLEPMSINNK